MMIKGDRMVDIDLLSGSRSRKSGEFFSPRIWGMRTPNTLNKCQCLSTSIESPAHSYLSGNSKLRGQQMTDNKITEPKIGLSENHLTSNINNDTIKPTKHTSDTLSRQLGDNHHQSMADESAEYPISTKATRRASLESASCSDSRDITKQRGQQMTDNLVVIHDNQAITTSIKVAEVFGKEHKNVLDRIKQLTVKTAEIQGFSAGLNFKLSEYKDETGRSLPMYELSRDGFTLLAMGFTGKKALEFKLAYINQFNKMEQKLKSPDFTTSLTVVKQHSRKLPTVRVKKEIVHLMR